MGPARWQSVGKGWSSPPTTPTVFSGHRSPASFSQGPPDSLEWRGGPPRGTFCGRENVHPGALMSRQTHQARPGPKAQTQALHRSPRAAATVHAVGLPARDTTQQLALQLPPSQEALRLLMPGIVDSWRRRPPAPRAGILNSEASGGRTSRGLYYIMSGQIKQSPRNRSSWPPPLEGIHHRQPWACTPGLTAATGHSARVSAPGAPLVQSGCWSLSCRGPQQLQGPT